jgi:hypothetical protein
MGGRREVALVGDPCERDRTGGVVVDTRTVVVNGDAETLTDIR